MHILILICKDNLFMVYVLICQKTLKDICYVERVRVPGLSIHRCPNKSLALWVKSLDIIWPPDLTALVTRLV